MLAIEFVSDRASKAPAADIATAVHEHAVQSGLLLLKAGIHGNCVRVLVSLVATDEQIGEALDIFEAAVGQAVGAPPLAATAG
jgi:4-aminobutyrate aminotransferase/(S)-3-amino-2-methylpropionate transaminase